MKIKLIAIDLDGTLLQHDHTVSEENIKAINEAMSNNVEIVICTGRVFNEIPKQVKDIKGINYFITSNGARIFDKDKNTVFQNTIPKNIADEIMLLLKKYDCIIDLYLNGDSYYPKLTDELIDKHQISEEFIDYIKKYRLFVDDVYDFYYNQDDEFEKINLYFNSLEQREIIINDLRKIETNAQITYSMSNNLEINSPSCTKGNALAHLVEKLGMFSVETMAIGDSDNDIAMLKYVGTSIAMGNAPEYVKSYANYETDLCENHGVAKAIYKFCLK